jgi:signal transduction histidine kinase
MAAEAKAIRIVDTNGAVFTASPGAPDLGAPSGEIEEVGELRVASTKLPPSSTIGIPQLYVQYARDTEGLHRTIGRMWLFLAGGVIAGTALAALAGVAIARRAMQPIAALTAAAGEIASTRDPSRQLPIPPTDDEVAELAQTLDQMLGELEAARTETQQMVMAQREFIADASHELRTPLTSVLANLELLSETLPAAARSGSEEAPEMIESALRSARRMSRLVADLLLLARADAGRTAPRTAVNLADIVEAAVAEAEPIANGHEIRAEVGEPPELEGNADELHRMVANLIDNAIRHTPRGSVVRVGVGSENGSTVIEVSDNGPGLPRDLGDQIFERFVRGSGPADLAADAGSGLGLAIVLAVVRSHGGSVTTGASESGGARFSIRFPATSARVDSLHDKPDHNDTRNPL